MGGWLVEGFGAEQDGRGGALLFFPFISEMLVLFLVIRFSYGLCSAVEGKKSESCFGVKYFFARGRGCNTYTPCVSWEREEEENAVRGAERRETSITPSPHALCVNSSQRPLILMQTGVVGL